MFDYVRSLILIVTLMITAPAGAQDENETTDHRDRLQELVSGDHRSEENKARNQYRHPVETLTFFGLEPTMTVVEIAPGGGWYREIIEPFVQENGQYVTAGGFTQGSIELAPAGSTDMVLTFRNMHNFMSGGYDLELYQAAYDALKPGGVFGVVEHRGLTDKPQDPKAGNGYVREDYAIERITSVGFELVASSDINNNPKDTKDYERGVWSLPPTLTNKFYRRDYYLGIGESDRFTLKFVKPASED